MDTKQSHQRLSKFLTYILERRPDEFGLVPDNEGYLKIKELLKAINEEEGWGFVRKALIEELLVVLPAPPIEINGDRIRGVCRDNLPELTPCDHLPKLLHVCVTRKSYPVILENGIKPTYHAQVILSATKSMASRIGQRRDPLPVLITVNTAQAHAKGVLFYQSGELLHTADIIPPGCFSGPPVPKDKPQPQKKKEAVPFPMHKKTPGSFELDLDDTNSKKPNKRKKAKDVSWKRDKKRLRREKNKEWPM